MPIKNKFKIEETESEKKYLTKKTKRTIYKSNLKKDNNSNSTSNLNNNKKKLSKSKDKIDKNNLNKNDLLFKTIPIKINNNFDLIMQSNNSELEITKDSKNNYCTIVPQVLNMLNLNIYKINSTNKSQMYSQANKNKTIKNSSQNKISKKKNKKVHIKRSFDHKYNFNIIKTNKKKKRVYTINKIFIDTNSNENNIFFKNGPLTSRQFSSGSGTNKIDENKFLKNILFSPSSGNIGYGYMNVNNNIISKNKNSVIPINKATKRVNNLRNNIPLTSRCFLNTSSTRNKKKGNLIEKNYFNIGGGILGKSNSIINKGSSDGVETNNNTNTICSVKSIGHIFKTKKKSNPYNKPSLNFLINNNK